jgi:glutaconyl-CoA/methylmalonyl-CoA decarboxylase subunit gamma
MAKVTIGGRSYEVEVRGETVVVDGQEFPIKLREDHGYTTVTAGGVQYRVQAPPEGQRESGMAVQVDYRPFTVEIDGRLGGGPAAREPRAAAGGAAAAAPRAGVKGGVTAQIAGRIIALKVKPGDAVKQGDVLLLLEAMKMENEIKAPADGTVKEILVKEGDRVTEGQAMVVVG